MTPAEAGALLGVAASFDNRKPDPDAAKAWCIALDGLRFEDCRDVIVSHYRTSTEWVMPKHVIEGVKKLRASRLEAAPPQDPPLGMDADDVATYLQWRRESQQAIADGDVPPEPPPLPHRNFGDLKALLPSVPPVTAAAPSRDAEWKRRKEAVRAELAARRPIPTPEDATLATAEPEDAS